MFRLLLWTYQSFLNLFDGIQFNGLSIIAWGLAPFILGAIIRFVMPMLHLPVGHGILSGFSYISSRYQSGKDDGSVSKNAKPPRSPYSTKPF